METMRLSRLIEARCLAEPQATAFVQDGRRWSNQAFAESVDQAAAWLRSRGIGRGDAVALWLLNSPQWIALLLALARLGARAIPINTRYRSDEVAYLLGASGARLLITHGQHPRLDALGILAHVTPAAAPGLQEVALLETPADPAPACAWPLRAFGAGAMPPGPEPDGSDPEDVVILFSTSGTTKAPKLVMHTQATLIGHARRCAAVLGLDQPDAVLLAMLPMCGVFGLNSVLAALAGRAVVVIQDVFDAPQAVALMQAERVTHAFGSDEMFRRLAQGAAGPRPFPHARYFGFGAFTSSFGPFARECVERGMPLHGLYGSSEVQALFSAQPGSLPLEERLLGGGRPMAAEQTCLRVRDTQTGALLPDGMPGELEIRSPGNFVGYFGNPQASAQAMHEGYFRTGDLGYLRGDGSFVFMSRLGDAMRLGGHLVNPEEIEEAIKQHEGVEDAHVVSADVDGQPRPVAFVVASPEGSFEPQALLARLRLSVAGFKVPCRVWIVEGFPQTVGVNGLKTSRVLLRKQAEERLAAEQGNDARRAT